MSAASDHHPTYVHRALQLFNEYGDREALVRHERRYSYAELRSAVLDLAAALREHGVRPSAAVVVLVDRPLEAPILQLALHLLGTRSVWIDLGALRRDLPDYLRLAQPELLVYDARSQDGLGRELAERLGVAAVCLGEGGCGPDLLAPRERPAELAEFDLVDAAPASTFQTSGTTGIPKLVHHEESFYWQVVQLADELVQAGESGTRHLSISGLSYMAGQISALLYLFSGGTLVLLERFDCDEFIDTVRRERVESTFVAPPMLYALLDHPRLPDADFSSMAVFSVGGSAAVRPRLRQAIARFGPVLRITYGLSECPFISANPGLVDDPARPDLLGSCGRPYGDVRVQIRADDGTVLGPGEVGELWVGSKLNFAGYWGQPELTAQTIVDGWLRTHDLGYQDEDGYLYLVGRNQDMIIVGSASGKVFPRPIEDVLTGHPRVRAAAVIGVPDPEFGEAAHAYIVTVPGATVTAEELAELVAAELAGWWVPNSFEFVDALPVTASGKVDGSALRRRYATTHPARPVEIGSPT